MVSLLFSFASHAGLELKLSGHVSTDIHVDLPGKPNETAAWMLDRNDNAAYLKATATYKKATLEADVKFRYRGFQSALSLPALSDKSLLDPFRFDSNSAFIEIRDVAKGLDLRVGRQVINWGTADTFNPTSNLNPKDFEDPLLFAESMGNQMVRADWTPRKDLTLTAVWVPVFRGSLLPTSASAAFTDANAFARAIRNTTDPDVAALIAAQSAVSGLFSYAFTSTVAIPETSLKNSMGAFRMAWKMLSFDWSASYFIGFDHVPRGVSSSAGSAQGSTVPIALGLEYPRKQVVGLDVSGQIPGIEVGIWGEVAAVIHDTLKTDISPGFVLPSGKTTATGIQDTAGVFYKVTAGLDYSFTRWLLVNAQYVRGFFDEFGASQLDNYVVAGAVIKGWRDKLEAKLFAVVDIDDGSHIIFPQLILKPFGPVEFTAGVFWYGGIASSKFGQVATGPSRAFLKLQLNL
ncbi:MAG: hypothetical protein HYY84_20890 [Deltaproteobacteria bacterium]|nr:hypothetical protein [Deltaproteobacteria bacterium]